MAEVAIGLGGKVVLITGGGSGIGRGAALAFADAGASIAIVERTPEAAEDSLALLRAKGVAAEVFLADVSVVAGIKAAVDAAAERFGRLDVVYANAGINGVWAPIEEITEEEYDRTMDVNLKGTFFTIQAAVPHLKKTGKGVILVTASVNGTRMFSNTGATVYSATKGGQTIFVKMLAPELGPHGIRINAICPGSITTNIGAATETRNTERIGVKVHTEGSPIPLERRETGDPEQVGRVALFLASNLADHVTGEIIFVDGGQSLVQG